MSDRHLYKAKRTDTGEWVENKIELDNGYVILKKEEYEKLRGGTK